MIKNCNYEIQGTLGDTLMPSSWSSGAIECYARSCICKPDCSNYSHCQKYITIAKTPPMKIAVIECVKRFGIPKGEGIVKEIIKE